MWHSQAMKVSTLIGSHLVGIMTLFNLLCTATIMKCDRHIKRGTS